MGRKKKCKIFVSYSRHDEALVRPLAGLLGAATDDSVFLDVSSIKPGDPWEVELIQAVEESIVFVLCWCCESAVSEFVAREIDIAFHGHPKRIVPVLFCAAELPEDIAARQWIDLRGHVKHKCKNWMHEIAAKHRTTSERASIRIPATMCRATEEKEAVSTDSVDLDAPQIAMTIESYFEGLRK